MEMVYNELSVIKLSESKAVADARIFALINTYIAAKEHNFKKIRFSVLLEDIEIAENYSIKKWLEETTNKLYKNLLLSARDYPEYNPSDNWYGDEYSQSTFAFVDIPNGIPNQKTYGLVAAHLYKTLSISLSGNAAWEKNILSIVKTNDSTGELDTVNVPNVFSSACFDVQTIKNFIESVAQLELVESQISHEHKPIHFRDDHGNDDLDRFAKRIRRSPYVIGIINSLAWKGQERNFIKDTFADGIIYLRLHWDDRGLGMAIQSTGRNKRETDAIAALLKQQYDQ